LRLDITEQQAADAAKISLQTWRKYEAGGGHRSVCTSTMAGFLTELTRYIAGIRDGT
jgi:hypothetical protein